MTTYDAYMLVQMPHEYSGQTVEENVDSIVSRKIYRNVNDVFEAHINIIKKYASCKIPQVPFLDSVKTLQVCLDTNSRVLVSQLTGIVSTYVIGLRF